MQYHCVQCNELFTIDASDDKPRCPKCLRQHGLRPVEATAPKPSKGRSLGLLAGALVLLAAAGGGYTLYQRSQPHAPGQVPLAPLAAELIKKDVQAFANLDSAGLERLLEPDAKLSAFAARTLQGQSSAAGKVKAVCAALQERKKKQAFVAWSRAEPRDGAPLTASAAWSAIERDGARVELYPLELAAIAAALLRSQDVPVLIAEVYRFPNERSALDPSGRFGYHVVVLPGAAGAPTFCDPYAGRSEPPNAGDYVQLNDVQAVGAAFGLRALHRFENGGDAKGGLADAEAAVKLLPSSPSARSVRAALLLSTGGVEAGSRDLEAAAQLRSDAARHNNLAVLALVSDGPNLAAKQVAAALSEAPDFALAHLTLASVHLMRGERDLARTQLEQAERLEPDLPPLPQVWAEYYASTSDLPQAIAKAEEAVRRRPKDPKARLVLARVDRAAGRYDDMRKQAREILQRTPQEERERMTSALHAMLGPTALEDSSPDTATDTPSTAGAVPLAQGTAPSGSDNGPHLLDTPPGGAQPGALQLGSSPSKLKLGGGGSQLKLDLKP